MPAPPSGDMPLCVAFISIFYLDKTPLNFAPSRKQELPPCQSLIYILCHDLVYFRRVDRSDLSQSCLIIVVPFTEDSGARCFASAKMYIKSLRFIYTFSILTNLSETQIIIIFNVQL